MIINGFQKMTLLDFPGKVACTIFLGGCNFRCPFCHNAGLVLGRNIESRTEEEILSYLEKRKGLLDGVCITGGEPTLRPDLLSFIGKIKALGYAVKLDTNGSNPALLKELASGKLIDYVAMDIKNCMSKYPETCGDESLDLAPIKKSIDLLLGGCIDYEFRTTVVKELHSVENIASLSEEISGAKRYFLQNFVDSGDLLCGGYSAHDPAVLKEMLKAARKNIPETAIRGIENL